MRTKIKILSSILAFLIVLNFQITSSAEQFATQKNQPIRVGIIDTGISLKHINPEQVVEGINYVFPDNDTYDRNGHGTATAGMIVGSTKLGIEGSCPEALVVPLVTYDHYPSGAVKNGDLSVICNAIYDAIDFFGCRVINISMGILVDSEELRLAMEYAEENGAIVVSAVGNDNLSHPEWTYYPANYPTVIGVGAADFSIDQYITASFSQRNAVSVLAKGIAIATVSNRNMAEPIPRNGTSFSCAYVSGLCAKILSDNPSLTPAQVRTILYASAYDIGSPGVDSESGWGIVGLKSFGSDIITRGMLVNLLYESVRKPEAGEVVFTDVSPESYYARAVAWASENGIVSGYGNGQFGPDKNVTREQYIAIIARYAKYRGVNTGEQSADLSIFKDEGSISSWARDNIKWAVGSKLLFGKGNGILDPAGNATRSEVRAVLERFFVNSPQKVMIKK